MVETVKLPFGVLNNIPGVSGVEAVEFDVPQVDDIVDPVVDQIPDDLDLRQIVIEAVEEALIRSTPAGRIPTELLEDVADAIGDRVDVELEAPGEIAGDIADEIETSFDLGEETLDQLAERIVTEFDELAIDTVELDISGFFGPLEEDLEGAFESLLQDLPGDVEGLRGDVEGLIETLEGVVEAIPDDGIPTADEIVETAVDQAVEDLEGTLLGDFLDDPIQWLEDNLLDADVPIDPVLEERLERLEEEEGR